MSALVCWVLIALVLGACGGGGGGGGGGGSSSQPKLADVSLLGIFYRTPGGELVDPPPFEAPTANPPTQGAPLNQIIVFAFSGEPEGPFDKLRLPVFTTPEDLDPTLGVPAGLMVIPAKGEYLLVGNTVEFHPFVPSAPLELSFQGQANSVPGLLPGSTYTARVSDLPGQKVANLVGPGAEERFGTTSNPAVFFPSGPESLAPPTVLSTSPGLGVTNFSPNPFSERDLATGEPLFPPGPAQVLLQYDRQLLPTTANLLGDDLDGDGLVDPSFYLSARATPLLVGHGVAANSFGTHGLFGALSGLEEGGPPAPDGSDILLRAGPPGLGLGNHEPLFVAPASLVVGRDAALAFAVFENPAGSDFFGVIGPVLGDASFAQLGRNALGTNPGVFDTGLGELVGLSRLAGGRLIGFDRATRRIYELRPTVLRQLGDVDDLGPKPPRLLGLSVGDGADQGFRSQELKDVSLGGPLDVLDLAVAPSGRLVALAQRAGASFPSLLRLAPIDRKGNGQFAADGGLFLGEPGDVLLDLPAAYVDVLFVNENELLALDRTTDRIDRINLLTGEVQIAVPDVAGFGMAPAQFPDGLSPARCLALGELRVDVEISLLDNAESGARVQIKPRSVLPAETEFAVMQRNGLQSIAGTSLLSAGPHADYTAFGARQRLRFSTAAPTNAPGGLIADAFEETFDNQSLKTPQLVGPHPEAEWAEPLGGTGPSGYLRAARGATDIAELGDFRPAPTSSYNPSAAYQRRDEDFGELTLTTQFGNFREVMLDTTAQSLPLPDGSTPGVTTAVTIVDGVFRFRDIVIPESVRVIVRGRHPLTLIATGNVRIDGMIDVSGVDGFSDDSFNSGFIPVRGGPGGPGAGRGGDSHPTLFDPTGPGSIDQYVTPETGERGFGPALSVTGNLIFNQIGGHGGLSTAGYTPPGDMPESFTQINDGGNSEHSRVPGGGGGSMRMLGQRSRDGSGAYLVQSNSSYFPFDKCPTNNKLSDALYGNDENFWAGLQPNTPLQCVYFDGAFPVPNAVKPGADPGDAVFVDGDRDNDYYGPGGEMTVLMGGQGGGGGGSRVDSLDHRLWSPDVFATPTFPGPPFYPGLLLGVFVSPTVMDAKGGGGGGGGGSLLIRSFGDIVIGKRAYLDASGGHGGGGERVQNSSYSGGGGGGSGGVIALQAAGRIVIEADEGHVSAGYIDLSDDEAGASLDVSGGFGRDARTTAGETGGLDEFTYVYSRSDGGSGSFGLIQIQAGANDGMPEIDEGAFLFARQRAILKLGRWTDDPFDQGEHFGFLPPSNPASEFNPPDSLRYIDMLHYRYFQPEGAGFSDPKDRYFILNGSFPPIIASVDGDNGQGFVNEWPEGSGKLWADTRMMEDPDVPGNFLVEEPEPDHVMRTYAGWDPDTIKEFNNSPFDPDFPFSPGETYKNERLPFGQFVEEPSGKPLFVEVDGKQVFDPSNTIPVLPVVPLDIAPPVISAVTTGTSVWLDFGALALRARDGLGRSPPFFEPTHGTYNPGVGLIPPGKDGHLILGSKIQGQPARRVALAGTFPIDPGLFGGPDDPPYNDIEVDSLDLVPFGETDALTDNADLTVFFQGARPVRLGSAVPDPATLSPWVSDLSLLNGYSLVRFRVQFDLQANPENFPFNSQSFRPQVERLRMRMEY